MSITVRQAQVADFYTFFPHPLPSYALEVDGIVVALGGLIERQGRWWGFLDCRESLPAAAGVKAVRMMRAALKTASAPVHVHCDDRFETSTRLLRACGFVPTEEFIGMDRVWICTPTPKVKGDT